MLPRDILNFHRYVVVISNPFCCLEAKDYISIYSQHRVNSGSWSGFLAEYKTYLSGIINTIIDDGVATTVVPFTNMV